MKKRYLMCISMALSMAIVPHRLSSYSEPYSSGSNFSDINSIIQNNGLEDELKKIEEERKVGVKIKGRIAQAMPRSNLYLEDIFNVCKSGGMITPYHLAAVINAESNWNPKAKSKKNAMGLGQLMPYTAKELGAKKVILVAPYFPYLRQDERFKVGEGVSLKIISGLVDKYFDKIFVVAIYCRYLKNHKACKPDPEEIRGWVRLIPEYRERRFLRNPRRGAR